MDDIPRCSHLDDFLGAETKLIRRHIDEHNWCNQISNQSDGIRDFIKKYGWIMREFYCGYACQDREDCQLAGDFLPNRQETDLEAGTIILTQPPTDQPTPPTDQPTPPTDQPIEELD